MDTVRRTPRLVRGTGAAAAIAGAALAGTAILGPGATTAFAGWSNPNYTAAGSGIVLQAPSGTSGYRPAGAGAGHFYDISGGPATIHFTFPVKNASGHALDAGSVNLDWTLWRITAWPCTSVSCSHDVSTGFPVVTESQLGNNSTGWPRTVQTRVFAQHLSLPSSGSWADGQTLNLQFEATVTHTGYFQLDVGNNPWACGGDSDATGAGPLVCGSRPMSFVVLGTGFTRVIDCDSAAAQGSTDCASKTPSPTPTATPTSTPSSTTTSSVSRTSTDSGTPTPTPTPTPTATPTPTPTATPGPTTTTTVTQTTSTHTKSKHSTSTDTQTTSSTDTGTDTTTDTETTTVTSTETTTITGGITATSTVVPSSSTTQVLGFSTTSGPGGSGLVGGGGPNTGSHLPLLGGSLLMIGGLGLLGSGRLLRRRED